MSRVHIIYGSEASVLTTYLEQIQGPIFRIYNNRKPNIKTGCIDLKINEFEREFTIFCASQEVSEIIFVGAAFSNQNNLFLNESMESLNAQLTTNVINYVMLAHVLLPLMIARRYGRFIFLSSFRAEVVTRGTSLYSASKSFVESFFKTLGVENGAFGVSSISIQMGYFDGKMLDNLTSDQIRKIKRGIGSRRLGTPQDLSDAIIFCIENNYLNGGVLDINGGLSHS